MKNLSEPDFYFISCLSHYNLSILLYESTSNSILSIEFLAKWLKKYMDKKVLIDMSINISNLPNNIFSEIISENYDFIKTKFVNSKYVLHYSFGEKTKVQLLKELNSYEFQGELSMYLQNEDQLNLFIKIINKLSRKEKISKLIN